MNKTYRDLLKKLKLYEYRLYNTILFIRDLKSTIV